MKAEPFSVLTGVAAPLLRVNIDTDAIIPSREMKAVSKEGLADGLFAGWRYVAMGGRKPDPTFVLNNPAYAGARILLAGPNLGCGSSREHAVWALAEFGFRAVVAPSFNPIFKANCVRNGVVPAGLPMDAVEALAEAVAPAPQRLQVTVDLPAQRVVAPDGRAWSFDIGEEAKVMLLDGLDAIDLTLRRQAEIAAFRGADAVRRPWAYL